MAFKTSTEVKPATDSSHNEKDELEREERAAMEKEMLAQKFKEDEERKEREREREEQRYELEKAAKAKACAFSQSLFNAVESQPHSNQPHSNKHGF